MPASPTDNATAIEKNDGIFSIGSAMFTLSRKQKDVQAMLASTKELAEHTKTLRGVLVASMQDAIKQGNDLATASAAPATADAKAAPAKNTDNAKTAIETYRQSLNALLLRYKQLSGALIPLGQVTILLDATTRNLGEWNDLITQEWKHLFSGLILRLIVLGVSLMIPWLVSELARRATIKYVHDAKRQRQLRILRQILFSTALIIMILLNFVTEFGSLATYAGFLTAGLAVALQTVLLSLTAHFFFFGRFGVRAGDRVTISGVTGDVIQVGMLRIYLMELIGQDSELRPSGKIVAFPNSVLFNSTAFSKQVTGANYVWNELTILLDAESDFASASKKITDAVNAVYGEYKEAIELQHTALVESTRLSIKVPAPRSELRFTDKGLACVVFYPLIAKRASEIHGRIITKLIEVFHGDPKQKLLISTPPKIVAVTEGAGS
jgi:small-conductance mechanosensitive channel